MCLALCSLHGITQGLDLREKDGSARKTAPQLSLKERPYPVFTAYGLVCACTPQIGLFRLRTRPYMDSILQKGGRPCIVVGRGWDETPSPSQQDPCSPLVGGCESPPKLCPPKDSSLHFTAHLETVWGEVPLSPDY